MYKKQNFMSLFAVFFFALIIFVPKTVMATDNVLSLSVYFTNDPDYGSTDILLNGKDYDLDALNDGSTLVDFSDSMFEKYHISGKIVYNNTTNTVEFQSINNSTSDFDMFINVDADVTRDMTFKFQGKNDVKGVFQFSGDSRNSPEFTIIAPDLKLENRYNSYIINLYGKVWKFLDSKIQIIDSFPGGQGIMSDTPIEILNSNIDINATYQGMFLRGILNVTDSSLSITAKGDEAIGLYAGDKVVFKESKLNIYAEGKSGSTALFAASNYTEISADFVNSEIDLKATLTDDAEEGAEAYAINGNGYYDDAGIHQRYINISNSILVAQGDTGAINSPVEFEERLHDAYVKVDLKEDRQYYPVNKKEDKVNLGGEIYTPPKYKYVSIEAKLKTFTIDADSQPVDQNIYEFVRWESKGFIVDAPSNKKTTVRIPIVWPKEAYINAVWEKKKDISDDKPEVKPDIKLDIKPEVIYHPIPINLTDVKTETVYKTALQDMPYLVGYPDKTINPEGNMTRGEAIATLVRLERIKGKDGRTLPSSNKVIFSDVKAETWYTKYINYAYDQGWLETKAGEAFYPDRPITRGELAQLISHVDTKNSAIAPFADVKGHKYEAAINQAYGNERIKGYEDGTFRPDGKIKRVEVATMLNHLYDRRPDRDFIDKYNGIITSFNDLNRNHWGYYQLVEAFEAHEYVKDENGKEEWIRLIDASTK